MIPAPLLIIATVTLAGYIAIFGVRKGFVNGLAVICMTALLYAALVVGCIL